MQRCMGDELPIGDSKNTRNEALLYRDDIDIQSTSLLDLPMEIVYEIVNQFSTNKTTNIMFNLSITHRQLHHFFQPALEKRAATKLLEHVLQGKSEEAKALYTRNPRLLFINAIAEDYAVGINTKGQAVHRIIATSPFRAMLGAGDIWMINDIPDDCFDLIIDKEKNTTFRQLAAKQFAQQFPNGYAYPAATFDFKPLINAIINDQQLIQNGVPCQKTEDLLTAFREYFIPRVVKDGHFFNLNELIKAFELYEDKSIPWNPISRSLFWCKVIGYLERLVATVDAQALCQGIRKVTEGRSLERNLEIGSSISKTISYFPLDAHFSYRLGYDFCVDSGSMCFLDKECYGTFLHAHNLLELCQLKTKHLDVFSRNFNPLHLSFLTGSPFQYRYMEGFE